MYKKFNLLLLSMILLMVIVPLINAVPPVQTTFVADQGLEIVSVSNEYLPLNKYHVFNWRVYNASTNSYLDNTQVNCSFGIKDQYGETVYSNPNVATIVGYRFYVNLSEGNFSDVGYYHKGINCITIDGSAGGSQTQSYEVNVYGEALSEAEGSMFNYSMLFMFFLFSFSLIGCIKSEHYIIKFVCYWICHVLFIVGTFSMWQFNSGYAISFLGLAGVWKILFYIGITTVFPMVLLSIFWIFYIHTFNEHMQKLVDKGENPESAFRMAKKKSGGWLNGR